MGKQLDCAIRNRIMQLPPDERLFSTSLERPDVGRIAHRGRCAAVVPTQCSPGGTTNSRLLPVIGQAGLGVSQNLEDVASVCLTQPGVGFAVVLTTEDFPEAPID